VASRRRGAVDATSELAAALDLTRSVKFLGAVPHAELLRIYQAFLVSLVVVPSIDLGNGHREGIPVALIEAMSYGLPVVANSDGRRAGTCHARNGDAGSSGRSSRLWRRRSRVFCRIPPARADGRGRGGGGSRKHTTSKRLSRRLIHEFTSSAAPSLQAARQYAWH